MSLVSLSRLLEHAETHRYAVGYFESWNMESLLAVKDAAEQSRSPVILGINGGFLENAERNVAENLHHYGALGAVVARQAAVPMALILNEANEEDSLYTGLAA